MKILRKTTVKQVITDQSRELIKEKFNQKIGQAKKELEQLQFEKKKLTYQKRFNSSKVEERFSVEENKRKQSIEWLEQQIGQLDHIPNGSELIEGEVDELIEVEVGDQWEAVAGNRTITIKDGQIIDIN
ncbi:YlqD family protein [Piscibacillus salipiscarius]|uniref:YlqD family protein n=1 Tax=Piscibacillus salipiscarius TaxID=299480 RepID=A0ABW5Q8R8_9BACI|nr:YlqD family protein [Piscibacillus salipiscarius]